MDLKGLKVGVVMPVWLQEPTVLAMTERAIRTIQSTADVQLYIVPSRLRTELISAHELERRACAWSGRRTRVICTPVIDNSVAKCWNVGCRQAFEDGCHFVLISANDVLLKENTVDTMVNFGLQHHEIDLWSATDTNRLPEDLEGYGETADFCCFMIRPLTFCRFGTFDEHFRPAYFEDNDYYARVIIGGGRCGHVYAAQVSHLRSQTVKLD